MQHAVERDEQGRSNYAMCAVNPSCVGKTFDDAALREIVDTTSDRDTLLEIVNFNVEVRLQFFMSLVVVTDMPARANNICAQAHRGSSASRTCARWQPYASIQPSSMRIPSASPTMLKSIPSFRDVGQTPTLRQRVIATAAVFFRRFYCSTLLCFFLINILVLALTHDLKASSAINHTGPVPVSAGTGFGGYGCGCGKKPQAVILTKCLSLLSQKT
jgi:hypothetical protein